MKVEPFSFILGFILVQKSENLFLYLTYEFRIATRKNITV